MYIESGTYVVSLTVTDDEGATDTISKSLVVSLIPAETGPPTPSSTATPDSTTNLLTLPVGILVAIVITIAAIIVAALIFMRNSKNKNNPP